MNVIINEVNSLIDEMEALDKFNDDVFIQYLKKWMKWKNGWLN